MRELVNALLSMIGASSLTDQEWNDFELDVFAVDLATYNAVLKTLDSRELVSNTRDRLRYYFLARGVSVPDSVPAKSNILIGGAL